MGNEADQKKAKNAAVNAAKKQRKVFCQLAKEKNYWTEDDIAQIEMMERVEFLCVHYNGEELIALNGKLGEIRLLLILYLGCFKDTSFKNMVFLKLLSIWTTLLNCNGQLLTSKKSIYPVISLIKCALV